MMFAHLQIELLTDDLTSYPEFMKVLTTVAVACKDQHFIVVRFVVGERG